ncbi:MAG: ribosome-associated translation inhibitor RaiA [Ignavibacteria bacterium]|jgi:putative sigma-54 modulation protein|nr:ribosome-associated translation inhibitor RaiA [Ignavibacteria bacterium]
MNVNITARHFKAKDSTQGYIHERLEELNKYNENIIHADVILSYDKPPADSKHCEIKLKLKERVLTTKETAPDFERAIDLAVDKIETQLYKFKDKIKTIKHTKQK